MTDNTHTPDRVIEYIDEVMRDEDHGRRFPNPWDHLVFAVDMAVASGRFDQTKAELMVTAFKWFTGDDE